jgi:CRISPR-associated protein Csb1
MTTDSIPPLTFEQLSAAVTGPAAAIRLRQHLQPTGGPGDKIFPPTYAGGVYAIEQRRVGNETIDVVLLDSVQSQANRLELALQQAYDDGRLQFPLLLVDFSGKLPKDDIQRITALEAPHRIADAIFRDSMFNGLPFRPPPKSMNVPKGREKCSPEGERFAAANVRNATALFELCPTALIFGVWDSTGAGGGLGNKFARVLVSEIVGLNAVFGSRTSSRVDPLKIEKCDVYEDAETGEWTVDPARAKKERDKEGKDIPVPFKRKKADKGKPSELNHGNVTPDLVRYSLEKPINIPDPLRPDDILRDGNVAVGGVTITEAVQTTVLSLPGLRRLQFPDDAGKITNDRSNAARTVLAALALSAVTLQREQGYFLRSRCDLMPVSHLPFEIVNTATEVQPFFITAEEAGILLKQAVTVAGDSGLRWAKEPLRLTPKPALVELVRKSRELVTVEEE